MEWWSWSAVEVGLRLELELVWLQRWSAGAGVMQGKLQATFSGEHLGICLSGLQLAVERTR